MNNSLTTETEISQVNRLVTRERERSELWKQEHEEAMGCMDLELMISTSLFIAKKALRTIGSVYKKAETDERLRESTKPKVQELLELWLWMAKDLRGWAGQFEKRGYKVEGVEKLQSLLCYVQEVISQSNPDAPWKSHPSINLVEVDQANREFEHNGGRGISHQEVFARARAAVR